MKRLSAFIAALGLILTMNGCAAKERRNDFLEMSDSKITEYYFAATDKAVLSEICSSFNKRSAKGLDKDINADFNNGGFLSDIVDFPETDLKFSDTIINIGFIENGELCNTDSGKLMGIFPKISDIIGADIKMTIQEVVFKNNSDAVEALKNGFIDIIFGISSTNESGIIYSSEFCTDRLVFYSRSVPASITYPTTYTAEIYETEGKIFTASPNLKPCGSIKNAMSCFTEDEQSAYFGLFSEVISMR